MASQRRSFRAEIWSIASAQGQRAWSGSIYYSFVLSNFGIVIGFLIFFMTAYILVAECITADPRLGEILLFRCKHLSTTRNKQSRTDDESSAQNFPRALSLRRNIEQGSADGDKTVGIQEQTNVPHKGDVCYKAKVDYLLSSSQYKIKNETKFQIAWPPSKPSQRLRLGPKLLLQIQQLPPNHRPVPVLEIWQPSLLKSKSTRGFLQPLKLGPKDLYATLHQPYITKNEPPQKQGHSQERDAHQNSGGHAQKKETVAAMCHPPSNENTTSEIHFRDARCIWLASTCSTEKSTPCYRFAMQDEESMTDSKQCQMILQWEKRTPSMNGDGAPRSRDTENFVLVAIDRKTHRKNKIATMNRSGFEITIRERLIFDHPRTCLAFPDPVSAGAASPDSCADLETWLYTHVLTFGIWVASQERWLA